MSRTLLISCIFLFWMNVLIGSDFKKPQSVQTDLYARFESFNSQLGKDFGDVVDIEQDQYGYIWFAATNGLYRFDGNTVRRYLQDDFFGSLPSSKVFALEIDTHNRLWIGTERGICHFDYSTDRFIPLFSLKENQKTTDSLYVRSIYADGDSLLWMETLDGSLWKINQGSLALSQIYKHNPLNQPYYYYHDIYRIQDGTLFFGGRNIGPFRLNEENKAVRLPINDREGAIGKKEDYDLAWIYQDDAGTVWMGALDGIYHYDNEKSFFTKFLSGSSWAMCEGSNNKLWFGTGRGISQYDLQTGTLINYEPNDDDAYSLTGHYIYAIFEDRFGRIWVSNSGGVDVFIPDNTGIGYLFHIPGTEQSLASSRISSLASDGNKLWIGTAGKGIDCLNLDNQKVTHFNPKNTKGLLSGNVRCISLDRDGNPYCGLWAGVGFGKLDTTLSTFEMYTMDESSTDMDWYNDLEFDPSGKIYVGFWGAYGLSYFDPITKKHLRFFKSKFHDYHNSRHITTLHLDRKNRLWMGTTRNGLHVYFPDTDTSFCFHSKFNPETGIDQKKIFDICEDTYGNIWVAANGLYLLKENEYVFTKVNFDGMNSLLEIFSVLCSEKEVLWLLTNHGLIKFNTLTYDWVNYESVINLNFTSSLAAATKLDNGDLAFAGSNGLAIFNPAELKINVKIPEVFYASLNVFDKVQIPNLAQHEVVHLDYQENFFSIQIGSESWGSNDDFTYSYLLEGFNKDWMTLSNSNRMAQFTNVPPGEYVFRVKVENDLGWNYEKKEVLNVHVLSPFWMKWWFIFSIIILVMLVGGVLLYLRVRSIKLNLANSELNQKLLRLQMNPHFIFNSLFAIQNFIYSNKPHEAGNYLSDFASLIRLILDNSRFEYISFEKEIESIDLYLKMQQLRMGEKFTYSINYDQELYDNDYHIPPMLAQPFLENAIEHGIKTIDVTGEIVIEYKLKNDKILFRVEDNGIGISASKEQNKNQAKKHESLAISICKKRLSILNKNKKRNIHFEIEELKNEQGKVKGTRVEFSIPFEN